jgi:hypothetical protein
MPNTASLRALLPEIVDYAGFFPPAGLALTAAVDNFAGYLEGPQAWMLGRLVVPAGGIEAVREISAPRRGTWRLSAVVGDTAIEAITAVLEVVAAFNEEDASIVVDMVEVKAADEDTIDAIAAAVPPRTRVFVEIPTGADPAPLVRAIAGARLRAKIRTGGVTAEAFPPPEHVARFIRACYAAGVAFKATAGLHHPLRGDQALTYEPGSARGVMHGFLNVFLTAAFCYNGLGASDAERLLEVTDADEFCFDDDGVSWRDYRVSTGEIEMVRRRLAVSFGSCSFTEPVEDLKTTNLL